MPDFEDLWRDLQGIAIHFNENTDKLVRTTALVVDQAVVTATPVDTGRARSNWQVSVGTPILSTIETYGGGQASISGAVAQARAALNKVPIKNRTIYITNNLPYIQPLNDGHSPQARPGFVQKAIAEARARMATVTNQFTSRTARRKGFGVKGRSKFGRRK